MGVKQWVRAVLVLSALPSSALALGLGDIRLNSPLNAPLDAEIELVNATPEELASLRVQLASRETFARYGLEWPAFLGSVTLAKTKSESGRDVLRVRSAEAITEPFLTLLVDANWGRGRLVREYTLLLDPPVFTPTPAPVAAVQAPAVAVAVARSGAVTRPAPAPAPAPAAAPRPASPVAAPAAASGGTHTVRRGETLSGIARGVAADRGASPEQAMVGLYRANRAAFDGSMDDLRAGAVLRIPDTAAITAIDRDSALAEIRRQRSEWRSRATAAGGAPKVDGAAAEGRLRLVPPSASGAAGAGGEGTGGDAQAIRERVATLEKELSESRRLLELRSAQIAELQRQLGTDGPPASGESSAAAGPSPAGTEPVAPADSAPAAAVDPAVAAAVPAAAGAAATEPRAAAPGKQPGKRPAEVVPPIAEPSLLDSLLGYWWAIAGALALAAGLVGYRRWQARRAADLDDDFGGATTTAREMTLSPPVVASSDTARLRRPNIAVPVERSGFVVEESGEYEQPRVVAAPASAARTVAADDTLSSETGINLDQGDPLAEADFHMAYGLYDQAADLVRLAAAREPERRDLKLKLAEVYFVWGNRDEFLKSARELHRTVGESAAGEWDKIVIMGRQIAPEDPLFDGATARGVSGAGLDLQLDGGSQPIDFDVFGDGSDAAQSVESVSGSDLDFGPSRRDEPTLERPGPAGRGATRETSPSRDAPTAESPRLDVALDDFLGSAPAATDAPTVEQPALRGGPALRAKLDAALRQSASASDQTAELAIDDLGLDLGDLDSLAALDNATSIESGPGSGGDRNSPDAPTMLASFDADAQRLVKRAGNRSKARGPVVDPGATGALETLRIDTSELDLARDSGATSMVAAIDATQLDAAEYDLSGLDDSLDGQEGMGIGKASGLGRQNGRATRSATRGATPAATAQPSIEPVTISEVGTKLDLARAYMDMGDPDGARNILHEVLSEGSVSQKQEANRLLESLPG